MSYAIEAAVSHAFASQPTQAELIGVIDQVVCRSGRFFLDTSSCDLLQLVIQDISHFKKNYDSSRSFSPSSDSSDQKDDLSPLSAKQPLIYLNEIKSRFDFLKFILVTAPSILISLSKLDTLWLLCVEQARETGERDIFLDWLVDLCNADSRPSDSLSNNSTVPCTSSKCTELLSPSSRFCPACGARQVIVGFRLPLELVEHIFENRLVKMDRSSFTPAVFRCFQSLFSVVNKSLNATENSSPSLKGLELLWEVALGVVSISSKSQPITFDVDESVI